MSESTPALGEVIDQLRKENELRQDEIFSGDISIIPSQEGDDSGLDDIEPTYYDEERPRCRGAYRVSESGVLC